MLFRLGTKEEMVSLLITTASRRIVLHNIIGTEPCNESAKMIKKVFEKRIPGCTDCERCSERQQNEGRPPNTLNE
jgi:YtxC-like family.